MGCCLSILRKPRLQSELPAFDFPTHDTPGPVVPATSPGCVAQEQAGETTTASHQQQDVPAPLLSTEGNEEIGIPGHDSQTLAIPDTECAVHESGKEGPTGACDQPPHVFSSSSVTDKNEEIDIDIAQYSGQAATISNLSPGCATQDLGEIPTVSEQLQHTPSGSTEENQEIIITAIRASDVALDLGRPPAWFYVVLHHNGLEWRTENKPLSTNNNVVEWSGLIPILSDLSAVVRLEVYASFEYQPMLGAGERLQKLTTTLGQLLDRSNKGVSYTFSPEDEDIVSPCSSVLVTVMQQKLGDSDPSGLGVIGTNWSIPESRGELEDVTNQGHSALSCYRKHREKRDLERSIEQFERALDVCPRDDPRQAAAKSNLAMANLILSRAEGMGAPLEVALRLYWDALTARPVGHRDRPLTLIQLASVHLLRLQRGMNSVDEARGGNVEGLLHEAIELSPTESYEMQAATVMLQLCARHRGSGRVQSDSQSLMGQDSTPGLAFTESLSAWMLERFDRFGDLADLQRAIVILEGLAKSKSIWDSDYYEALGNLGAALSRRFERLEQLSDLEDAISTQGEAVRLIPNGHPNKPAILNNLAISFQRRFERLGRLGDLESAISRKKEVVHLTPNDHLNKPGRLSSLSISLKTRFKCLGQLRDLEDALSTQKEAVRLTPDGHLNKPARLNSLGVLFQNRFERLGQLGDLEDAVSTQKEAVLLTPDGHLDMPGHLNNLGISFRTRFGRLGQLTDLENAISTQKEAVHLTPNGHPDKPVYLNSLGNSFQARFERIGQLSDLEDAISRKNEAVRLTSDGHPDKPARLHNLGNSFRTRFERLGQLSDLEDAASNQKEAVRLTPDGHSDKPMYLSSLGISFRTRFERLGQLGDLEDAISTLKEVVRLTPNDHPDMPTRLNNLGISFQTRFVRHGRLNDLEDAISRKREAIHLTPNGHPNMPIGLSSLSTSLQTRFESLGELSDLEDAISAQKEAARLTPNGHPDVAERLNSLSVSFQMRFERLGQLNDLEDALSTQKEAVRLTPIDHLDMPGRLYNLGNSFCTRFGRLGQLNDLEDAISAQKEAVRLSPDGHPDKLACFNNLAISLQTRFEHLGQLSDLEDAISAQRGAVRLTPDGHPDKPTFLNNLGVSFQRRFDRLGELSDLKDAILTQKEAVRLTSNGHPDKPALLNNLSLSFQTHFQRLGRLSDLEDAISTQREAVRLTPNGHPDRPMHLSNLGNSLQRRYEHLRQLSDLEDAILTQNEVVHLSPDGHTDKPGYLNSLGISFQSRFERLGQLNDLEDAILRKKEAVRLTPSGHPDKPIYLYNLGNSLQSRFERLKQLSDLEDSILTLREAVHLTPDGHPDKPGRLNALGNSLQTSFLHLGRLGDLEGAISRRIDAVRLTPHDHPRKSTYLDNLAGSFVARFLHLRQLTDLKHAISLSSHVASVPIAQPRVRLSAAQRWIHYAPLIRHPSLLHAYSVAASLIPQLAWVGLPLSHRYDQLIQGADVIREAAAAALDAGFPETALEWLEQGRSVIWGDLFQLRNSYDELSSAHPEYASRLRALSTQLDQASATHEQSLSTLSERAPESLRAVADRHRALAIERDKLLQEIRRLPGFEKFLLRKPFSQLRAAARSGPVVILNAAKSRCDALIVVAGLDHVIHVPLPTLTIDRSLFLQKTLQGFVRDIRVGDEGARIGISWKTILSPLWKSVVKPVLDALAIQSTTVDPSRIFWCPTGPLAFLPIHAAGFYDEQHSALGHRVFDFVVSSYVPTLSTLLESSNPDTPPPSDPLRLLFVPQPPTDGHFQLSGVAVELQHISEVVSNSPVACTLSKSSDGTVEEVLDLMREADWVHFACHGVQEGVDSGLFLANKRRLKLGDIVALSRPPGGLAFLSACETAKGDKKLSDEAIHIAAGMLLAGYGGVIGTMWVISDVVAPDVAKMVYEKLLRKGPRADYREAARALHEATRALRERGKHFNDWIPFIHVGL